MQKSVSLASKVATYGSAIYGESAYDRQKMIESSFSIKQTGKRLELQVFNNNMDEDFFITQLLIDFQPMARKAA